MAIELLPHQAKAVEELRNGVILKGGVGVGKSITAIYYWYTQVAKGTPPGRDFQSMANPCNLYVITTARKREYLDWEKEAIAFGVGTEPNAQGVSIKVDSWNNIAKYEEVKDAFFIFDEQRLVGKGAWVNSFLKIAKRNKWIVLSATPGDVWSDYIGVFIANGFYKNRTQFLTRHAVYSYYGRYPKLVRYLETGYLEKLRRRITVDMPYPRRTRRQDIFVPVDHDVSKFSDLIKRRWHIYEDRPVKDASELFALMRKLVNSDLSRCGETMRLLEKHPKMIIFYNFNYELDMLRIMLNSLNYKYAEWNGHKHEDLPQGDKWVYLVQYTAGAEGWNCTTTDTTLFWSLNYSYRLTEQAKGRTDRLNTPYTDLYYYFLKSSSAIDRAIMNALKDKKDFNEKDFKLL